MKLREDQEKVARAIKKFLLDDFSILLSAPCGWGILLKWEAP